jgi:hypothetical protein
MTLPDPHANQAELTQDEKRAVLANDRKVREQGATFKNFADASFGNEATRSGGRFAKLDIAPVIHRLPDNSPWSPTQNGPGPEPPLGFSVDQMDQQSGAPDTAPVDATDERSGNASPISAPPPSSEGK